MIRISAQTTFVAILGVSLLGMAGCVATGPAPEAAQTAAPAPVADAAARAKVQARVEERVRALEPEFWTRRSRDGEASANEWLRKRAVEIGQEEAARGG